MGKWGGGATTVGSPPPSLSPTLSAASSFLSEWRRVKVAKVVDLVLTDTFSRISRILKVDSINLDRELIPKTWFLIGNSHRIWFHKNLLEDSKWHKEQNSSSTYLNFAKVPSGNFFKNSGHCSELFLKNLILSFQTFVLNWIKNLCL